jgi:hypothetical protein
MGAERHTEVRIAVDLEFSVLITCNNLTFSGDVPIRLHETDRLLSGSGSYFRKLWMSREAARA